MPPNNAQLARRNQEIGSALAQARQIRNLHISQCAKLLDTTRRRYSDIERGITPITHAELEILLPFLGIPARELWLDLQPPGKQEELIVAVRAGQILKVVVT